MMSTLIHLTISLCLMNKTDNSSERFFRLSFLISQSQYRLKCFALASLPEQVDSDYQCLMTLLHQVFNDTIYCLLHEGAYVCCLCYFSISMNNLIFHGRTIAQISIKSSEFFLTRSKKNHHEFQEKP